MLDAQIFHVEKRQLAMLANHQKVAHIHAVDDALQALDSDVLVVSFGQRTLVEQDVRERIRFRDLFQEHAVAEMERGVAAHENRASDLVNSRPAHGDGAAQIHRALLGLGVFPATCVGRKAKCCGIGKAAAGDGGRRRGFGGCMSQRDRRQECKGDIQASFHLLLICEVFLWCIMVSLNCRSHKPPHLHCESHRTRVS